MSKTQKNKPSLEKSFADLEKITDELQSGGLDLEKPLSKLEEGLNISSN